MSCKCNCVILTTFHWIMITNCLLAFVFCKKKHAISFLKLFEPLPVLLKNNVWYYVVKCTMTHLHFYSGFLVFLSSKILSWYPSPLGTGLIYLCIFTFSVFSIYMSSPIQLTLLSLALNIYIYTSVVLLSGFYCLSFFPWPFVHSNSYLLLRPAQILPIFSPHSSVKKKKAIFEFVSYITSGVCIM